MERIVQLLFQNNLILNVSNYKILSSIFNLKLKNISRRIVLKNLKKKEKKKTQRKYNSVSITITP